MLKNSKGFTLIEMVFAMLVFVIIMGVTFRSVDTLLSQTSRLSTSEESNIEGVVGLEMMRHDLEQTGFGLPWSFSNTISYNEAANSPASNNNDATSKVPRAIVTQHGLGSSITMDGNTLLPGTDYITLKGTTLGTTNTSQRWTYLNYTSTGARPRIWSAENLAQNDSVIVLNRIFGANGLSDAQLVFSGGAFYTSYNATQFPTSFSPTTGQKGSIFQVYGVDPGALRMPFNRSDYFVTIPGDGNLPGRCAPGTGVLHKGVVNHADGSLAYIPLLDCVADMEVAYGWNIAFNGSYDGQIESYSNADASTVPNGDATTVQGYLADPAQLRQGLKMIKVYILAQEGIKDLTYTNNQQLMDVGDLITDGFRKQIDLKASIGSDWQHYRWKLYRIVVRPKNLAAK